MKISIVIPVYNGAGTIESLVKELIDSHGKDPLEIVLVNDASTDSSHQICGRIFRENKEIVKYVNLAKNFGEHNAVLAGLNYASGDYAVIIDDDFQNPPEEIRKVVDTAVRGGYDAVYTYYEKKQHPWFRNMGSGFNNLVATWLLDKPKDLYLSSFKCMNRFIINEVIKYTGPFPYIDGLILRATRNIGKVDVRHDKRAEGKSGYTLKKLVRLWLNMFINFSILPLRVSTLLGFIFSAFGGIAIIDVVVEKILFHHTPAGLTSVLIAILTFSGIQLMMLGLIGEYVGKQFLANNQTPQYVIRDILSNTEKGALK
jgi:undecaprenyl-phosphate 4-deoxy-4-formamido-L-arabinose transferase